MSLELRNVTKTYREPGGGRLPVLNIANFTLAAGEQVVLVGSSGGGKTTLLNIIAGITTPDEGQVRIDGTDLSQLPEAARDRFRAERLGYVFQTFNLLPAFTALENVLLGMSFSGKRPDCARAIQLLDQVGLKHRLYHKPSQMSVGEQQRTSVARALVNTPRLLLANVFPGNCRKVHE
jgi:putative ABC transport system ATP-binding protein